MIYIFNIPFFGIPNAASCCFVCSQEKVALEPLFVALRALLTQILWKFQWQSNFAKNLGSETSLGLLGTFYCSLLYVGLYVAGERNANFYCTIA